MKNIILLIILNCFCWHFSAAQMANKEWHHLDPVLNNVVGISTDKAYSLLAKIPSFKRSSTPVIVAVIDVGIDSLHEDLKRILYINHKEVPGNNLDDDKNGFVDDIHGWNFLGGKNGVNILREQKEETRIYARLKVLYEGKNQASLNRKQFLEYKEYQKMKTSFESKLAELNQLYKDNYAYPEIFKSKIVKLKEAFNGHKLDSTFLHHLPTKDTSLIRQAKDISNVMHRWGQASAENTLNFMNQGIDQLKSQIDFDYNIKYSARSFIGDSIDNDLEKYYGNSDSMGPEASHGTTVAGIIGADRSNGLGVKGVASCVRILSIRATLVNGDERDKDVSNAIKYAVDSGAKIINLSFGKYFSSNKTLVDEAIRYANHKGVLLIHASGNDHLNLDSTNYFPTPFYENGKEIPNLITVGASSMVNDQNLVASFSNYGLKTVDVFAPGVDIYSCSSGNSYNYSSGTSVAAPIVSGIASVLKFYFPYLSPVDLKRIILNSAEKHDTNVFVQGINRFVNFSKLSKTGAIVNFYQAVRLAIENDTLRSLSK